MTSVKVLLIKPSLLPKFAGTITMTLGSVAELGQVSHNL